MPLTTAQTYLKGLLDGLPLPTVGQNLTAYIAPPTPGDGTAAAVYIWGSTGEESRRTMPRARPGQPSTGGSKEIIHKVDLWLVWFGPSDDPQADSLFPSVIDAVTACLRNTPALVVQQVQDPMTGQTSDLLNVGEDIRWDYAPVHSTADERWLVYTARLILTVKEWLQA